MIPSHLINLAKLIKPGCKTSAPGSPPSLHHPAIISQDSKAVFFPQCQKSHITTSLSPHPQLLARGLAHQSKASVSGDDSFLIGGSLSHSLNLLRLLVISPFREPSLPTDAHLLCSPGPLTSLSGSVLPVLCLYAMR